MGVGRRMNVALRINGDMRMGTVGKMYCFALAFLIVGMLASMPVHADSVEDFYKGKVVKIIVGGTAEGGYAPYARMLQMHMGQYIPGQPQVVVQFMPGAGGLTATNYVYNVAPKDGTIIGSVQRNIVRLALIHDKGVKYDPAKIAWLGSLYNDVSVCASWDASGIRTIQDAMRRQLIVGGTGLNDTEQFPAVLNNVIGTRFKIISGYKSSAAITLAMERGEVTGRCGWSWDSLKSQRPEWLAEKKIDILVQMSMKKLPEIGDVPLAIDLAKNKEQRDVLEFIFGEQNLGKPFVMSGEVPADRVAAIRKAFMRTAADATAVAEMTKMDLGVAPLDGKEMQAIVTKMYATPQTVIDRAGEAVVYREK
jgi:tripartite-type tricarboxylate transporter receptor subunit TctC